uniref:MANSC domain-containing protein n=1 Tax=Strigamia maritima TaxID=126957 RepID=T1JIP8_STRMM
MVFIWLIVVALSVVADCVKDGGNFCPGAKTTLENASVYRQVTPHGNTSAGRFVKIPDATRLEECAMECCEKSFCHIVFMFKTTCFLINCASDESCEPVHRDGKKFTNAYMIPLRSVTKSSGYEENIFAGIDDLDMKSLLRGGERGVLDGFAEDDYDDDELPLVVRKSSVRAIKACEYGILEDCARNEECIPKNERSRQGLCGCVENYARDPTNGKCKMINGTKSSPSISTTVRALETSTEQTTSKPTLKKLVVSAGENKTIQLPENEVTLSAYAVGGSDRPPGSYHYEWTLVSHPDGDDAGTMGDKNSETLKLTSAKGVYTFKVSVSREDEYGEATVNVTVLPPERINKPPVAVVNPSNQTVKLPNTDTVLDGSASSDDDKIVSYHWEQVTAPINYQPDLTDTATLQLKNLTPGLYRFMLTVTDSNGVTNSTFANVTVIKEMDYPPVANAGHDVIIYLPQNEVVLSGNLSTDDKGIKSWEWTKGPDTNKAVDMQNTHTPFLRLSSLEVGMYTLILKVTDTADQTSETVVRVFVKPENNETPTADAGPNVEISLPNDTVVLDGSKSHDDVVIKEWHWQQIRCGPSVAKLDSPDSPQTNASGLTKGTYVFQLTVVDGKKVKDSKTVAVTVKQTENQPPKANAGGDRIVQLPVSVVTLNGSASTDDLKITSYEWTRDPQSLAAGLILENSDKRALLKLANLIPGRYIFQLKVMDDRGAADTDTAWLIVKQGPFLIGNLHETEDVEMQINADIFWFSELQKVTLARKLALLLHDEGEIIVRIKSITAARHSGRVILVFYAEKLLENDSSVLLRGPDLVRTLKKKLQNDNMLLDFDILTLDTVICQNNCSGHGSCDQATKRCLCEAFWMENFFRYRFYEKESNCDWSVLYVIIVLFALLISIFTLIWSLICLCRRMRFRRPRKRHRYTLLEDENDKEHFPLETKGKNQSSSLMMSDSEQEYDTVYEPTFLNGKAKANGHLGQNGLVRPPKRVKT